MKQWRRYVVAAATSLALVACGGGGSDSVMSVDGSGNSNFDSAVLAATLNTMSYDTPSAVEVASLTFMREEEKLAQDVYAALDAQWGSATKTFGNISNSEATHTEAVRLLLARYELADPAADQAAGSFQNTDLQALYTELVGAGSPSLVAALQVGVEIEELDIHDIQADIDEGVDNADIIMVYENLLKGSRNHLRAYYKALQKAGGSYTPQHITQDAFDKIVNSATERG
jgi:hypothetical protein